MIEVTPLINMEEGKVFIYQDEVVGVILGVDIVKYSHSLHKKYKLIFAEIKKVLKELGLKQVYALCDTDKERKFNELFGLVFTGKYAECSDGSTSMLMVWEI